MKQFLKISLVSLLFIAGTVFASSTIGTSISTGGTLTVGDESTLDALIQGYAPAGNLITYDGDQYAALGIETTARGGIYATSLNSNAAAIQGDGLTNTDGGNSTGLVGYSEANGDITADSIISIEAQSPRLRNGATAATAIGLKIDDITDGTDQYAIKTGLGKVQFGDESMLDPYLQGWTGAANLLVSGIAQNGQGLAGFEIEGQDNHAATAVYGVALASGGGYANGVEGDGWANSDGASGVGVTGYIGSGNFNVNSLIAFHAYSPSVGGTAGYVYGLQIDDISAGTNNWAIKTGAGKVQFGDTLQQFKGGNIASAGTTVLTGGNVFHVTGTTNITTLNTCDASNSGRFVTLIFDGVLTFTDGNNLKLNGNFTTSADDTINLVCDGSNWFETGRSAN